MSFSRAYDLAKTVNAWTHAGPYTFPKVDEGLVNRLEHGNPRPVDYATIKAMHAEAQRQVPAFQGGDVVDIITPQLSGFATDVGVLRRAMASAMGIKEPAAGLAAFWAGVRNTVLGA